MTRELEQKAEKWIKEYTKDKGTMEYSHQELSEMISKFATETTKELKAQIDQMKCCKNCAWWYKLPNGQRDCAEHCENLDNWSLRR